MHGMSFMSAGVPPTRDTHYLFIDGNYLHERAKGVCSTFFDSEPEFDYRALGHSFTKIFYYDSLPAKKNDGDSAFEARLQMKVALFDHLRGLDGWHVHEGVSRARKGGPASQKEVDILIAVDMLTHTHRKNMDRLTFIAGDQDFRPLLDAVVRDGMYVSLWYHPSSISVDLKHTADTKMEIDLYWFHDMMNAAFKAAHPLPIRVHAGAERGLNNATLEQTGYRDGNVVARLWRSNNDPRYMACSAIPVHGLNFGQLTHADDVEFLKRVYAELYGPVEWGANP